HSGTQLAPRLDTALEQLDVVHHFLRFFCFAPKIGRRGVRFFFRYLPVNRVRVKDAPRRS
ncbi:MAG: hypothetical protein K2H73_02430, partial [Treponemataceae bacterium]|nr:hypothetical protein [Treponemataceae bacterium]